MTEERTEKLPPITRRKRVEELAIYEDLQRVAASAGPLGENIKDALQQLVEQAGQIKVKVEEAA